MCPNKGNHPALSGENDAIYMKQEPQKPTHISALAMWHHCLYEHGYRPNHNSRAVPMTSGALTAVSCIETCYTYLWSLSYG